MISNTMGRRYSKALMAISLEREEPLEELYAELEMFEAVLTDEPRILNLMTNPNVAPGERRKIVDTLLGACKVRPLVHNFILLLLSKGRLIFYHDIVREFRYHVDRHAGMVRAAVTSARKLSPEETERVMGFLRPRFGRKIVLYEKVDPEIIGGLSIKSGSLSFDGSIRTQLKDIQSQLLEGVSSS